MKYQQRWLSVPTKEQCTEATVISIQFRLSSESLNDLSIGAEIKVTECCERSEQCTEVTEVPNQITK